ncbi:protein LOW PHOTOSYNTHETIC EFFICIENCY 1, chloroplastic-like [Vicia villosa]|uniref:protein LOW PHOTOSYNTHETIC EFFICIENCY 1, chloroplastic-like n=1 Tax=Vicia villosa TaxID=3911 RepID=UPI00273BF0FE|nr:protein LOW PHOTOSYNTHETIC EFFICIENCY 1, chloroplastic-like [Vicia villosa]
MIHTLSLKSSLPLTSSTVPDFNFNRRRKLNLGFLFQLGFPDFKYDAFFKPHKSHIRDLAPLLGWRMNEVNIETELDEEKNDSIDGINTLNSENSKNSSNSESYDELKSNGDDDVEEGEKEEYDGKIDVRELTISLQSAKTVEDVEEVLKDKGDLPLQVYSTVIRWFGKEKRAKSAMVLFDWMKKRKIETNGSFSPNLFIYNSLLGVVKQCEKFAETEGILNEMARDGVGYDVVTYNVLMAIYIEKGEGEKALDMLEEIRRNGLTPSPASYSQAVQAYRKMEDGNGALSFFVEFREKYRLGEIGRDGDGEDWEKEFKKLERFTVRACYQIMRCWLVSSENKSSCVLRFLVSMDNAGISLTRAELERLVWACTREDHCIVVKELYIRIRERYDKISLSVCNHTIWLMGKTKKWWAALEVYEDLLDKGPKPNNLSYELIMSHFRVLLSAARRRGFWKWGVKLLNKMEEKGLKPGSNEWNAVLIACSKASETSAAVQIFKRMVENGQKPTKISYGALLSALEKGKLYDEAFRVWDHMLKVGIEPNVYVYTIMASIYTAQGNFSRVDAIIQEMATLGIEVTVVTYNAIISSSARNGMSSAAYEWFHRMKVQNITPDEVTYEMLIEALANDGKPRLAYELYLRAQNEGLGLSLKAYDAVLQSAKAHGATIDVGFLGPRPADKKNRVKV